jgi:hypothetical protein
MDFKPLDFTFFLITLLCLVLAFFWTYSPVNEDLLLYVKTDNGQWYYTLQQKAEYTFSGPLGESIVYIDQGEAWMEESPCENKTCILRGKLHRSGQWTACLPNRIFLSIEGPLNEEDTDDQVY